MDRRKRRTLNAIQRACLALLDEKSFDEMTVLDISEKADISRGTFYLHYVDKYDMLDQFEQQLIQKMQHIFEGNLKDVQSPIDFIKSRYPTIVQLFTCLKEERELFQIIFQTKGFASLQKELNNMLQIVINTVPSITLASKDANLPLEFFIPILVSIITGATQQWLYENNDYTPEQLAKSILNIIVNGPVKAAGWLPGEVIDIDEFLFSNESQFKEEKT